MALRYVSETVIEVSHVTLLIDKHLDTCCTDWSSAIEMLDWFVN